MYETSKIIIETCKKHNIPYFSPFFKEVKQYQLDIEQLATKYSQLKTMCAELLELAERYHDLPEVYKDLLNSVQALDKIDHRLIYDANKILRRRTKKKEEK